VGLCKAAAAALMAASVPALADVALTGTVPVQTDGNEIVFSNGAGEIRFSEGGKITGLDNGTVSADSTDAVNGSQLHAVQQDLNNAVSTLQTGVDAAQNTADEALVQANKGWNIKAGGEAGAGANVQPGDTVTIEGGQNIEVTRSGTTITVKTADDISAATLASTGNTNVGGTLNVAGASNLGGPLTVTGATNLNNGVTVTGPTQLNGTVTVTGATNVNGPLSVSGQTTLSGGLDMAGQKITNVADGTIAAGSKDAVTGGQLYQLQQDLYVDGAGVKYFHANSTLADSQAIGEDSVAIGPESVANADASLAAGKGAVVGVGANGAIAQGEGATVAENAEAAIAIGQGAQAGKDGVDPSRAGVAAVAIGRNAQSNGAGSIAIGDGALVEPEYVSNAIAVGTGSRVTGNESDDAMALGVNASASAARATAIGQSASASARDALAAGRNAQAGGISSVAVGTGARAGGDNGISLGTGSRTATTNSIAIGTDAGVGTGDDPVNPGFDKTSHIAIGTRAGQNVVGNQTTAIGYQAGSGIVGDNTVSVGSHAGERLDGDHNISIGYRANARDASTEVEHAVAIGGLTTAATGSVAVGEQAQAIGRYATVMGFNARATDDNGVALGANARATGDSVALGSNSQAVASTGVGFLTGSNAAGNPISVVSVGGGGGSAATRRITNVADGSALTDAVNVRQLAAAQQNLADILGQGTIVDGKVVGFKVGSTTYSTVAEALTALGPGGPGVIDDTINAVLYDLGTEKRVVTLKGGPDGTESVRIRNLADAEDAGDAVNLGQLNQAIEQNMAHYYSIKSDAAANYDNAGATGQESIAIGPSAAASGDVSIAVGHAAVSVGNNATALGSNVQARGDNSTVLGYGAIAYDTSTVAIGDHAKSRGVNSIVIGTRAEADSQEAGTVDDAIVIGTEADVTADAGIAMGKHAVASATRGVAIGHTAAARSSSATAVGDRSVAYGVNAVAIGTSAHASGGNAQASGTGALATGADSIASGSGAAAYAVNGIALGKGAVSGVWSPDPDKEADNVNTIAIGTNASATAKNSVAIGADSSTEASYGTSVARYSNIENDDAAAGVVSVGSSGGAGGQPILRRITNVAGGMDDTDAVNVAQLRAVRNTGWTYAGNSGSTTQTMGSTVQIVGGATDVATSSQNVKTVVTPGTYTVDANGDVVYENGKIEIQFAETPRFKGADMGGYKVTGVAAGSVTSTSTDAVNGAQLYEVANRPITFQGDTGSVARKLGETQVIRGSLDAAAAASSSNIRTAVNGAGELEILLANNLAVDSLMINNGGPVISAAGVDMKSLKISNVAAGTADTDAVNLGQLKQVEQVASQGWNLSANGANASNVAPGDTVDLANTDGNIKIAKSGNNVTFNLADSVSINNNLSVGGNLDVTGTSILAGGAVIGNQLTVNPGTVVNMGGNRITNVAAGTADTDAVNLAQLKEVQLTVGQGWKLTANGADSSDVAPGATVDLSNDDGNIDITKTGNDVAFNLAKDIEVDSVTTGNTVLDTNGVTISGGPAGNVVLSNTGLQAGTVVISSLTGINAGGFRITNVAAGVADTDAVNVSQLKAVEQTISDLGDRAVKYDGNSGDPKNQITLEGDVSTDGGKTGGTKITNLARGEISATSTDAVNGSQIHEMGESIAQGMGGNSKFVDGKLVTELNVGGNTYTNVNDALNGVQNDIDNVSEIANKGWNVQVNGDAASKVGPGDTVQFINGSNVEITRSGTNITVAMAKDIKVESVTATKVSAKEIAIENGPTINDQGIDMNGKRITNLADGKNDSDAVNLGQLNRVAGNVNNRLNRMEDQIHRNDHRASAGIAAALATAGLPQAYLPGKSMFSVAGSTWRGESGYAMGLSTVSDNGRWLLKGSVSGSSRGDYGATVGVGFQW